MRERERWNRGEGKGWRWGEGEGKVRDRERYNGRERERGSRILYQILSPSCDKTFYIATCPESQLLESKLNGFSSIFHTNSQHCACSFIQERYPYLHLPSSISHKWCHFLFSLVHKWLLPATLCHRRRNTVP